jgi:cyclopropane-fatty-acyl-phospholipid synthase
MTELFYREPAWPTFGRVRERALARVRERALATLDAAGIRINGDRPFDIQLHDEDAFFEAVAADGLSGARDAYVDGHWDVDRFDELTHRLLRAGNDTPYAGMVERLVTRIGGRFFNRQAGSRGAAVSRHYDLGNDLYEAMLDPLLNYSCGYWREATNLDDAQIAKLDLVCRKLGLAKGMRLLDIGCGWGGLARFAAERYGVSVVGVTISARQLELARERCRGLPVELRLQDYRTLRNERFDAVASIGMFEHVGHKNYPLYFDVVRRVLADDGLFLLHTIGGSETETSFDPWTERNIFPNTMLPSARQITAAVEGRFVVEDWHNFGADYDRTLMAWYARFEEAWPRLRATYGERFYRVWRCYLLTSAGGFRARQHQLWQLVLSPRGLLGGHRSTR